jgi:hypothetical protein
MKNYSIFILAIVVLAVLAVPVAANGPDYGTTQKNGTWAFDDFTTTNLMYDQGMDNVTNVELQYLKLNWNYTVMRNPYTLSYPAVMWQNLTGYNAIPPLSEAKIKYTTGGTHWATVKWQAYKQEYLGDGYTKVNLFGQFEYVDFAYLQAVGADVLSTGYTVMYNNISAIGTGPYGTMKVHLVTTPIYCDGIGFGISGLGDIGEPYMVDSHTVFGTYVTHFKNEWGISNYAPDWSKSIMVLRNLGDFTDVSRLQVWNETKIEYDSGPTGDNQSMWFTATLGRFILNSTLLGKEYTIFDDNTTGFAPPPPGSTTYWIYTFDETTGNFLANTNVRLVNLTAGTAYNLQTNTYGMLRVSGVSGDAHTSYGYKTNYLASDWSNQTVSADQAAVQLMLWPLGVPPGGNCTVYFKVYDGTTSPYQPISGATVRISDGSVLLTDSAGTAQKIVLDWGNYTYTVEKTGFTGITRDLKPEGSTTYIQTIYLSKPGAIAPAPGIYDMNTEIGKLVDWIASTIFTLGVLIWCTLIFTVIGMFMLALRSIGGGSGTLFRTGLFPKNLFGRGGGGRGGR